MRNSGTDLIETDGDKSALEFRINSRFASFLEVCYKNKFAPLDKNTSTIKPRKLVTTETFFRRFQNVFRREDGIEDIFPVNCRAIKTIGTSTAIVVEEPPTRRTILVNSIDPSILAAKYQSNEMFKHIIPVNWFKDNPAPPYKFNIAMPYTIFVFTFQAGGYVQNVKVFFRLAPLKSLNDYLLAPPLNNLGQDSGVCIGSNEYGRKDLTLSKSTVCQNFISTFWTAPFNSDYNQNVIKYNKSGYFCDYFQWQYHSLKDPMFLFKADWIGAEVPTLNQLFTKTFCDESGYTSEKDMLINRLHQIFVSSSKFKTTKNKHGEDKVLMENQVESAHMPGLTVHVGDNIILRNGRLAILENIINTHGSSYAAELHYVCEGKTLKFKCNDRTINILKDAYLNVKTLPEYKFENGTVIKSGDLLKISHPENPDIGDNFYILDSFRKNLSGEVETRLLGMGYYMLNSLKLDDKEVVDQTDFSVNGIRLIRNNDYQLVTRPCMKPMNTSRTIKYKKVEVSSSGMISASFENIGETAGSPNIIVPFYELTSKVFGTTDDPGRDITPIFRFGNVLRKSDTKSVKIIQNKVQISSLNNYDNYTFREGGPLDFSGKDSFTIQGVDFDITYNVGEKFLVVDNENPLEMMNIKMLKSFEAQDYEFNMIFEDKFKVESKHLLIKHNRIYPEKFRKVTNALDGLTTGMKIVAKEPYIYLFPKKDANIIVAFVIDAIPEPLVVLSNGMTLWLNDVKEKFNHFKIGTKKWDKLPHAPVVNEFRLQAGDAITQSDQNMVEYIHFNNRTLNTYPVDDFCTSGNFYPWALYSKKYVRGSRTSRLLSLPTPRYSMVSTDQNLKIELGFPTPFGVIPAKISGFGYPVVNGRLGG